MECDNVVSTTKSCHSFQRKAFLKFFIKNYYENKSGNKMTKLTNPKKKNPETPIDGMEAVIFSCALSNSNP